MEKVIVFGTGKYYEKKKHNLSSHYEIVCFIDNRISENGDKETLIENNWKCYNPKSCPFLFDYPVLLMSNSQVEMATQLLSLNVKEESIIFSYGLEPYFTKYEELYEEELKIEAVSNKIIVEDECKKWIVSSSDDLKIIYRDYYKRVYPIINAYKEYDYKVLFRDYGYGRGTPIDRVYIERFLENNKLCIRGTAMEIADDTYIKKYGEERVTKTIITHVWGDHNLYKLNLETGEGCMDEMVDSLVCEQTLQYIFEINKAVDNIYKILKPNGVALITVPGIKMLSISGVSDWGEYWSFTKQTLYKLFSKKFGKTNVEIESYGNVKTTTAYMWGMCAEDLRTEDFEYNDDYFPFILGVKARKAGSIEDEGNQH